VETGTEIASNTACLLGHLMVFDVGNEEEIFSRKGRECRKGFPAFSPNPARGGVSVENDRKNIKPRQGWRSLRIDIDEWAVEACRI
jgi:hypothetical protein